MGTGASLRDYMWPVLGNVIYILRVKLGICIADWSTSKFVKCLYIICWYEMLEKAWFDLNGGWKDLIKINKNQKIVK